jgi:hypothetical protein
MYAETPLVTGDVDQYRNEPVIALAVHRCSGAHDGGANPSRGERLGDRLGACPWVSGRGGIDRVLLGHHASRLDQRRPGGDDEGAAGALERGSERLDRAQVCLCGAGHLREVVDVGGVDHAIRGGGAAAEAVEILEGAPMNARSGGLESRRCLIGACETDDLVSSIDELTHDGAPDEARRAGDECTHG